MTALRLREIAIYTRDYGVRQGFFDIDPRPLQGDDIHVIEEKLREIVGETKMTNIQKRFYKARSIKCISEQYRKCERYF